MRSPRRTVLRQLRLLIAIGAVGAALITPNAVAHAAVTGAVTEYAVPSPTTNGNPRGITGGPDGKVWFVTGMGQLGRITPGGHIREFPIATAQEITTGPDGNLWVTQPLTNQIGRINVSHGDPTVSEFPAPSPCNRSPLRFCMDGITAGPDGNVWFTEPSRNAVGRVTPAGVITEFPLNPPPAQCTTFPCPPPPPPAHFFPLRITAGSDGNLWFALGASTEIGRIDPTTFATAFFAIPNPDPTLNPCGIGVNGGITAGPDNNLWFSVEGGCFDDLTGAFTHVTDSIGRITTSGTVLPAFPISAGSNVQALTTGRDGNVWFGEHNSIDAQGVGQPGMQVGRLTPTGQLTEFVTPTPNSSPLDVTSGPRGDIWFSEFEHIGRIHLCATGEDQTGNCEGDFNKGDD